MSADRLEALAREAAHCRFCFQRSDLGAPTIDVAQPRWVGPGYWNADPRVCVLMLNPGAGSGRSDGADARMRALLHDFRDGKVELAEVLRRQRLDMPNWGRGRFYSFYFNLMGLRLEQTAFANVAWCSTLGDKYPMSMRGACFNKFTGCLLELLAPDVIVLSGGAVGDHEADIRRLVPKARVVRALHYANRESREAVAASLSGVREVIRTPRQSSLQP